MGGTKFEQRGSENYLTVCYRLDPDSSGTALTILQEDPRPGAGGDDADADAEDPGLRALKDLVESE